MKRWTQTLIMAVVLLVTMCVIALPALAEAGQPDAGTRYTWAILGTTAGATAATLLIVQYLKDLIDRWGNVPTRLVVLIVSALITIGAQAFTAGIAAADIPLLIINSFVVSFAAMGAYDTAVYSTIEKSWAETDGDEFASYEDDDPPVNPDNPA